MRQRLLVAMLAAASGVLLLAMVATGLRAVEGDWHTVDGGGGVSAGSSFTVRGSAGQPDAGSSSGVTYTVHGGFWGVAIYRAAAVPALALRKTVHPTRVAPGGRLTYTLVFSYAGTERARGVVITDVVPLSVTHTRVVSSGVAITQVASTHYAWQVQNLEPDDVGVITITGELAASIAAGVGERVTNTAYIASADAGSGWDDAVFNVAKHDIYLPLVMRNR